MKTYSKYYQECSEEDVTPKTEDQYKTLYESYNHLVVMAEKVGLVMWYSEGDSNRSFKLGQSQSIKVCNQDGRLRCCMR